MNEDMFSKRAQKHNNKDFDVTVTILAQESKTSTRKTLEAFWINAQNPEMNRKDEKFRTAKTMFIKGLIGQPLNSRAIWKQRGLSPTK
ncbi:hypothetical protein KIN20_028532 [Parelaphostrongylus tenuis]|uniref:Uncharacterized protein n=1 Tax=Parelaphostrongylus tenuis TaxID=148309 RepID=A0AAD5R128_PARTN|nr:hypothetical protein KIN20_028532 [Parelaphostrongylus tenuis]